jgi:hypothetical protein
MQYYYVDNSFSIKFTNNIEEYIQLLYEDKIKPIKENQLKELNLDYSYVSDVRKIMSAYKKRLPMYDIMSDAVYLVHRENIYERLYHDYYRFITSKLLEEINNEFIKRFMSNYDMEELKITYSNIFYKSFILNNYITTCKRPSYVHGFDHIQPYYNANELYYLAHDWNINSLLNKTEKDMHKLCKEISIYDISGITLLAHQMYIYNQKKIGLIKHYSLFGSYYMNDYLRKNKCYLGSNKKYVRNVELEKQIEIMKNVILDAPIFEQDHIVYRFVESDSFMKNLKVGETYIDPSFMSTTRNPFYYHKNNSFGFILIKIKLPAGIKGVGLCIESFSNFPMEEEIVLPPMTKIRLISIQEMKDEHQMLLDRKIDRKYVFEWVGNNNKQICTEGGTIAIINRINLRDIMKDESIQYYSISDRINYIREKYISNLFNQFICEINNQEWLFTIESYNSSTVYKDFFYYEVEDGIMITLSNKDQGNLNLVIEIGPELHINYYFRHSISDDKSVINLDSLEWINWLSELAYILGIKNIKIHPNYFVKYNQNDNIDQIQSKIRYVYPSNIYDYLKEKTKQFDTYISINPDFDYAQLDTLIYKQIDRYIKISDRSELYSIAKLNNIKNMHDLYIYIIENNPRYIQEFNKKISVAFSEDINPFYVGNMSYTLDTHMHLIDQHILLYIPNTNDNIKKGSFKKLISPTKIKQFENRLRTFLTE